MKTLRDWLSLVKFSHSIFALPFALQGAWLAAGGRPEWRTLGLVVVCAVAARSAAMAFNRLVDRRLDAVNPRTKNRELPRGALSVASVAALTVLSSGVFVLGAYLLGPLPTKLCLPVLAVLLGYSLVKRVSWAAHLVLGLSLGLAPLGAWIAVRGTLDGDLLPVLLLAGAVMAWVSGFDLIYACQDAGHDRRVGLHSIPARFGEARALVISRSLHAIALACLAGMAWRAELGLIYWAAILITAGLLIYEQSLVRADDLSQVNLAFFTLNGWVGIALFIGLVLDMGLLGSQVGTVAAGGLG